MERYSAGDLVRSLCGHDKDGIFIVLSAEDGYVTLCDGKRRKAAKKKKKKYRHVQSLKLHSDVIGSVLLFLLLQLRANSDPPRFKVHLCPGQPQALAFPEASEQAQSICVLHWVSGNGFQEQRDFRICHRLYFLRGTR